MQARIPVMFFRSTVSAMLALICISTAARALAAPAPEFTMTASNVSVSIRGSGVSNITLTSVNGYTGTVGVICTNPGGDAVLFVLPNCMYPQQTLLVPANGSVIATVVFNPPAGVNASNEGYPAPHHPRQPHSSPVETAALGALLLRVGFRKKYRSWSAANRLLPLALLSVSSLIALTGCAGHGGLAMTPGNYQYAIQATSLTGGPITTVTATIKVSVNQ
jgi:hypothetical protein